MTTLKRPQRLFSFTDHAKNAPRQPPPGDRLDAMFIELIDAINSTQQALAEIRRDDGKLRNSLIASEQLNPDLRAEIVGDIEGKIAPVALSVAGTAANARQSEQSAQLFAEDAERAVTVAQQLASGMSAIRQVIERRADAASRAAFAVDTYATDAENWANYSKAQADNAIAAKDEALQWAEYLAGPVVDSLHAPDFIEASKFPHGLFYQPVQGMGGTGGLWSAKWWAIYAQQLVGNAAFYYLGAWDSPPLPGEQNPETGEWVPQPIPPGSIYYDTTSHQLMVWNGTSWQTSAALTSSFRAQYVYTATADQTVFTGADDNGATPTLSNEPSDVFLNGVRLVATEDYDVDNVTSTLTLADPVNAGSVVQWDLLIPSSKLAPGTVNVFKLNQITPDGTAQDFTLSYIEPGTGDTIPTEVGDGAQLLVSLDGCVQEPGVDYTASAATLHFAAPPDASARVWAVWYQPGAAAP